MSICARTQCSNILRRHKLMSAATEIGRKGIQASTLLQHQKERGSNPKNSFTCLIIASTGGYEIIAKLAKGVAVSKAEKIRTRAKLEEEIFSSIIGYSKVHYKRLQKDTSKHLRERASNRLYRFAEILDHANELYDGDEQTALRWLKRPNPAFGDKPPMDMLKSEVGADMVDQLITQLELGILPF